jgi:diguanylate cyclase (GGDEF)-like protein
MSENKALNGTANEKSTKYPKTQNSVIYYRWAMFLLIFLIYITGKGINARFAFLETFAIAVIYNILVTVFKVGNEKNYGKYTSIISFIDIILLSIFIYLSGGINSDIFIILFFVIGYGSINGNISGMVKESLLSVVAYSTACILFADKFDVQLNYLQLFIRDCLFVMAVQLIYRINCEVRKYDELHKKEFKMARTDKLTGLANRHYFDQKLNEEVNYADSTGNPLNVLMFDLDNFKRFNDTYGHTWGDKLLTLFSDIIKQNIRKSDIPVRYGGEEFLILLRDIDILTAGSVGDRIRRQLERQKIFIEKGEERKKVTVSCGVAQYPKHSGNIREVLDYADQALYHAKASGKNIVVSYDEVIEKKYSV